MSHSFLVIILTLLVVCQIEVCAEWRGFAILCLTNCKIVAFHSYQGQWKITLFLFFQPSFVFFANISSFFVIKCVMWYLFVVIHDVFFIFLTLNWNSLFLAIDSNDMHHQTINYGMFKCCVVGLDIQIADSIQLCLWSFSNFNCCLCVAHFLSSGYRCRLINPPHYQ